MDSLNVRAYSLLQLAIWQRPRYCASVPAYMARSTSKTSDFALGLYHTNLYID